MACSKIGNTMILSSNQPMYVPESLGVGDGIFHVVDLLEVVFGFGSGSAEVYGSWVSCVTIGSWLVDISSMVVLGAGCWLVVSLGSCVWLVPEVSAPVLVVSASVVPGQRDRHVVILHQLH